MFSKLNRPAVLSARKPSRVPLAGVHADRQADLFLSVFERRRPGKLPVEYSQLIPEALELNSQDGTAMTGVEATQKSDVELDVAHQPVRVPA